MTSDWETFGPLLHGTARAWRQKLDERLKPMGLSQAKWRTLLHLSLAQDELTQAEIAARLGVEEPSVVTLLNRLEKEGWVVRRNSPHDRRCKIVHLGRRAQRVISEINATADELRHELLTEVPGAELQTCIKVLAHVRAKAEKHYKLRRAEMPSVDRDDNGQNRDGQPITKKKAPSGAPRISQ
jgi:MarR family transcriptional regulator for hemolysin